jgi:crotonobetainyl-CoA:carnitine CoA-transferase CaiB-like acyl-CoA transferase
MNEQMLRPLEGIRVLDFTNVPPGAACTTLLADLGAEVIRVESPAQKGKPSLVIGQVALSRGKKSLCLDMRQPEANDILLRMVPAVDIVMENGRPGAMAERGFGYPQANAANPGVIWCALTGFGQDGPYARFSGHDVNYLAHSGLLGALGAEGGWFPAITLSLQAGAMSALAAVQAALIRKLRTGKGAFVDVSLSEAATWFLTCGINAISERPFALPASPDRRLYECGDGRYVAIACAEPRTWDALCTALGCEELKDQLHRWQDAEAATQRLASIFREKPAAEWMSLLAPKGAAITVMNHAAQLLDDPHVKARGTVVDVAGVHVPANPLRIAAAGEGSTGTVLEPPTSVGAHTEELLASFGFAPDEIGRLETQGLI